jgi:hypothetical protein
MKNQIKIRLGNESQEPMIVYVSHWASRFELWACEKLNTGEIVFSKESNLIDFNYLQYKRMYYEWKIANQDIVKARFIESLNELQDN